MNTPDREDGGPAFPMSCTKDGHPANVSDGMSLRDFFAAHALAGFMDQPEVREADSVAAVPWLARKSYEIADAMLTARNQPKGD